MKVGIVTIINQNVTNFGNRLQNYASQVILNKMGFETVSFFYGDVPVSKKSHLKYLVHKLTLYKLCSKRNRWEYGYPKQVAFAKFNDKYIKYRQLKHVQDIDLNEFAYFVTGSDQVFNPLWYSTSPLRKPLSLLQFAENEQKVCMSPSFGIDKLPTEWERYFANQLASFPTLNYREEAGAKIIKELTGREAIVTIDPTLMLDKEDWLAIANKPKGVDTSTKYLLTCFLSEPCSKAKEDITRLAKENNLKVINLMDEKDKWLNRCSPSEFVYLVSKAALVVTDSFHACVFSFLFDKPFLVYKRTGLDMMTRIDTLLSTFDLKQRYGGEKLPDDVLNVDYSQGKKRLIDERKKLQDYLNKAMNIK